MALYEDRTYENLQAEALEDLLERASELPRNQRVDASEGSLIHMATSKQAVRLEEAYQDLDALNDQMLVDTQDLEHLIDSGAECGIPIHEGKRAVVIADLNCPCAIGDEFSAIDSDYNYIAIELAEIRDNEDGTLVYRYRMEADEEGIDPGSYRGEIEPEDYLEGFEEGRIVGTYSAGTEQEEEEVYRERRLSSFSMKSCAGNRDYYTETIGNLPGVGGVKVARREPGKKTIPCWIQSDDYGAPSEALLAEIKETMDPEGFEGEGLGLCPFGHILDLRPVEGVTIDIEGRFTFDDGYSFAMLRTAMHQAVAAYILELAQGWKDSSMAVVRKAMVESKLLSVTGVIDIEDVTLNGQEENITTTAYQVPVMGEITETPAMAQGEEAI